jgi:hypothetical protein
LKKKKKKATQSPSLVCHYSRGAKKHLLLQPGYQMGPENSRNLKVHDVLEDSCYKLERLEQRM